MRRALKIASVALITAGIVVLSDVALTLAWKEPVSSLIGSVKQGEASDELADAEAAFADRLAAASRLRNERRAARELARRYARTLEPGRGIGRIVADAMGADYTFVEGTTTGALEKGPGRYERTALPGEGKTIGIAGHRTTFLAPFHRIDDAERGDEITLEMPYGVFTYEVTGSKIVTPDQTEVIDDVGRERLVLTACHPLYSAAERFVVFARLTDVTVAGL